MIKNKTLPFPFRLLFIDTFQVVYNASFQMIYFFKTLVAKVRSRLFATNSPCTEHCHFFVLRSVEILLNKLRKLTKISSLWIDCALESSTRYFIKISSVN